MNKFLNGKNKDKHDWWITRFPRIWYIYIQYNIYIQHSNCQMSCEEIMLKEEKHGNNSNYYYKKTKMKSKINVTRQTIW